MANSVEPVRCRVWTKSRKEVAHARWLPLGPEGKPHAVLIPLSAVRPRGSKER